MTIEVLAVVLAAFTMNPTPAAPQVISQGSKQVFNGQVAQGAWFRVRSMKGAIEVRATTGRNVVVTASRRAGSGDDDDVRFEVKRDGANVTVCAIWPNTRRCDANGYDSEGNRRRDYGGLERVDFVVELPRGINLVAATGNGIVDVRNTGAEVNASSGNGEVTVIAPTGGVRISSGNGDLEVERARGEVEASTGNGDITVSTSVGPVSASSGNGRIEVEMASLRGSEDMRFSTGNGSIDVAFPANLSAVIDARVPYRNFETDFPIDMAAGFGSRSVEGKIGNGGRRIRFSTGNGSVRIRKTS